MLALVKNVSLSPRQLQVLGLVARELTDDEIACQLGISTDTVDSHLRKAFERLGANTRLGAVLRAVHRGDLDLATLLAA